MDHNVDVNADLLVDKIVNDLVESESKGNSCDVENHCVHGQKDGAPTQHESSGQVQSV